MDDIEQLKTDLIAAQRALLWFVDGAPGMVALSTREYDKRMSDNETAIAKARAATSAS